MLNSKEDLASYALPAAVEKANLSSRITGRRRKVVLANCSNTVLSPVRGLGDGRASRIGHDVRVLGGNGVICYGV